MMVVALNFHYWEKKKLKKRFFYQIYQSEFLNVFDLIKNVSIRDPCLESAYLCSNNVNDRQISREGCRRV